MRHRDRKWPGILDGPRPSGHGQRPRQRGPHHRRSLCRAVQDLEADNLGHQRHLLGTGLRHRVGQRYSHSIQRGPVWLAPGQAGDFVGQRPGASVSGGASQHRLRVPVHRRFCGREEGTGADAGQLRGRPRRGDAPRGGDGPQDYCQRPIVPGCDQGGIHQGI